MTVTLAVDCDYQRIHCWCSACGQVCTSAPDAELILGHIRMHEGYGLAETPFVLFEVASPVSGVRAAVGGNSHVYQLMKWVIFNLHIATYLWTHLSDDSFAVAPSNVWTKGYDVKKRHLLTEADAKNKDLRECQSMLWFHDKHPEDWIALGVHVRGGKKKDNSHGE